jgi:hypothetical protein
MTQEAKKRNSMTQDTFTRVLMALFFAPLVLWVLLYFFIEPADASNPHPLPQRILSVPAPEQAGGVAGGNDKVIYAKGPLSFKGILGFYTVRGYLKAPQPLSDAVEIYVRANDPADDPACKALTIPSQGQNDAPNSSVYVCERGQDDAKVDVAKFTNAKFASFCSTDPKATEVVTKGKFWIGVKWGHLSSPSLTLTFDNLEAIKVPRHVFATHPCEPASTQPGTSTQPIFVPVPLLLPR